MAKQFREARKLKNIKLIDAAGQYLLREDGSSVQFADAGEIFIAPKCFSGMFPYSVQPLSREEVLYQTEIWLEPISPNPDLRSELRGWYQIKGHYFENESGNRFSLNTYGAKWLAFGSMNNL